MECSVKLKFMLFFLTVESYHGIEFWDGLGVKWDANILKMPTRLPRTQDDAVNDGWDQVDVLCDGSKGYRGYAWTKHRDPAVTLLFDTLGTIAGIQAGISSTEASSSNFPSQNQMPPFVKSGDRYVITAYFVDPMTICSTGRSKRVLANEGTGTNLYLQYGPDQILEIPRKEIDVRAPWIEGKCFVTMGVHYWYGISSTMKCDELFPMFLLYNGNELNGFGWIFTANLKSRYYEPSDSLLFPLFMNNVPQCLKFFGTISVLHVFLDRQPALNFC